jgi:hypothetical protein
MTRDKQGPRLRRALPALAAVALAGLAGCGGGGNPLGNAADIQNPPGVSGQKLSFAYFERCVNPVFKKAISNGTSNNTCAASGCHDNVNGTGGALRLVPGAAFVDPTLPANTPDLIRTSDMYKNFYSAQGATIIGSPTQSRLIAKPLLLGVLHGGGLIFASADNDDVRTFQYWITNPAPKGQDEFSTTNYRMFTNNDPVLGDCIIQ